MIMNMNYLKTTSQMLKIWIFTQTEVLEVHYGKLCTDGNVNFI